MNMPGKRHSISPEKHSEGSCGCSYQTWACPTRTYGCGAWKCPHRAYRTSESDWPLARQAPVSHFGGGNALLSARRARRRLFFALFFEFLSEANAVAEFNLHNAALRRAEEKTGKRLTAMKAG